MPLLEQARFARALVDATMAMTARGLRVDDTLRVSRLGLLTGEATRLQIEARPIIEAVKDKLKRPTLYFKRKVCSGCRNGKKKRLSCEKCAGVGAFVTFSCNLGSDHQLKDILYNALRLPTRSRGGSVTTDEEALQSLVALDTSGLVLLALRYGKLATMSEIYTRIEPAPDGHVRSVFNPAGTYTGRFNSREAFYVPHSTNLQNLPGSEEGKRNALYNVRDTICPDAGEVFVEADLSQAEARVVALLSDDEQLIANWRGDWDAHVWTASKIFGVAEAAVTKPQRYVGKRSRHALNYGEGPNKFWRVVNSDADVSGVSITLTEAKRIYAQYHALHPNLDGVWWNRVERTLLAQGCLTSCFGARCNFYPRLDPETGALDADTLRAAIAWEPQHTVSRLAKLALLDMFRAEDGGNWRVLHEQHDSVLLGVPKARVWNAARALKRAMERRITVNGRDLTIPSEVFVCKERWSTKERIL